MRIAIASKSGTEVDQHFGHAERFLIFDFHQGSPRQVAEIQVEKYCSFDPAHPFRPDQFNAIVEALAGCQAIVTARIGDYPRLELEKAGLAHLSATGPIEPVLRAAHAQLCGCSGRDSQKCGF